MVTLMAQTARGPVPVEVVRKNVKNMNLRVRSDGSVCMSVPRHVGLDEAAAMLGRHAAWLERRLERREEEARRRSSLLEGGTLPLWGREVLLEGAGIDPGKVAAPDEAQQAVDRLYKREALSALPAVAHRYEQALGVRATEWSVRRMRTRWGSCTPSSGRIRINLTLAAYPPQCLEYVVAHELAHLVEPSHNARFHALVASVCPGAAESRALLREPPARA